MRVKSLVVAIVAALAAFGGGSAVRADMIYTNQAAFLADVQPGYYLETFNSLPQFEPIPSPLSFSTNGFSYTAHTEFFGGGDGDGFFNVGPPGDTWLSTNSPADRIVFRFTSGNVTAVGGFFFETDFFGDETGREITATLDNGSTIIVNVTTANTFVGFTTSSPILSLRIETGGPDGFAEWPTANDLIVGAAVPEPSTLVLAVLGVGGLLVGRAWRRRATRTERKSTARRP